MADVGISIEGLGTDTTAGNLGVIYGWKGDASADTDYTWTDGLVEPPTPGKDTADPRTAELSLAGFSASLHMRPSIRRVLLARQDLPDYELRSAITDTDTTIDLGETGASGAVYIGSETLLITADNGDNTYDVERGFWSSDAAAHGEGAGVYDRPPYYRNRLVYFWTHDSDTPSQRARGYLADIVTENGQTVLTLQVEGPLAAMQGITRMRHSPALPFEVEVVVSGETTFTIARPQQDSGEFTSQVAKDFDANGNAQSDFYYGVGDETLDLGRSMFCQMNGAIVATRTENTTKSNDGGGAQAFVDLEGNEFENDSPGIIDDAVYELALWQRQDSISPYPIADAESILDEPYQPLALAGMLLCSGDDDQIDPSKLDFLSGNLGLGIGWLMGQEGIDAFISLANEDRDIHIDQLELGWDGEPVEVLEVALFRLMLPFGYWLTPNVESYLIPRRFDNINVETYAEALANQIELLYELEGPPQVTQTPAYGSILQRYTASVGNTSVYDGTTVEGNAVGASSRLDKMVAPEESDLDYGTIKAARIRAVRNIITQQAIFLRAQMPEVTIRANDWELDALDYAIGEWATVKPPAGSDPIFYDAEGEDVATADLQNVPYAILITGRGWNTETDAYELDGRLVSYTRRPGRFIGPTLFVKSVTTDGSGNHVITAKAESDGGDARDGDAGEFSEGQPVQLYDTDSALRESTVLDIADITGDVVTLNGAFTATPSDDDQLKLAPYDDYDVEDFGTERGYCYLAGSDDTLGTDEDEADQWQ